MSIELKKALETFHATYEKLSPKWEKSNIIYEGEDDVHAAGVKLLPKLEQQTDPMYAAYVDRTRFLNAFAPTIVGLEGTATRNEVAVEGAEGISELMENITADGVSFQQYCKNALHRDLKLGLCGTLVDYTDTTGDELTVAEAEELNARPKFILYDVEDIVNWHYQKINNIKVLVMLSLKEIFEHKINEFEIDDRVRYRVLRLDGYGYYTQQLYIENDSGEYEPEELFYPLLNDKPIKGIPFFHHGEYENPPLYDLVTNNVKHYQLKAGHNHALHYIGLPTPWRIGVDPNDNKLPTAIGPQVIWDIENEKASVGFLEFQGKGLDHIKTELDDIKEDMAFLGAAMLVSDKDMNETAKKAGYRHASQTANLASIVIDLSATLTNALRFFGKWAGDPKYASYLVTFSTDFNPEELSADEILKRVQAWQSGGFSKKSLYMQLKKGEVEIAGETFEDEEDLINTGGSGFDEGDDE